MINRRNYKNICFLLALTSISCSDSEGWMSGIPLSNEKISFTASLQEGWSGGQGSGDKSRAVKPDFPGLAREQKVLTTDEAFSKPLYLHPIETVNKTLKNQGPTTRGTMNFDPVVNNFGVSANYIQKAGSGDLFHNQEAKKEGSNWFVAGNKTWPLDCSVSFYAYAPYNDASLSLQGNDAVVKNKTIHYTANTVDLSKQPDLIVAKSESNAFTSKTANKAVNLSFSHALTAITFSISADMIPGTVKSITVSGVYGQGDYDLSKASWVPLANSSSTYAITLNASVKAGESKALTDKNSALMMIPQDLGPNAKVSMVFNDGAKDKTVSFSLDGTSWKAGNHITYVLSSSKITTLKMGSLDYPDGWKSVSQIRTAYDPNDPNSSVSAGLFVVNEKNNVIAANVKLTLISTSSGTSLSLPADSKLKFSPQYNYFVYYPYQDQVSLRGLPVVNNTHICDVSSSTKFFADAIVTWKSSKITADQSTLKMMNDCDLQIGKASLDDDGCSVSFKMEHAMGLAVLNRESKSLDHFYKLQGYEDYTWSNGSVPMTANGTFSSGQKLFSTTATQGIMVVAPNSTVTFTNTSNGKDEWKTTSVSIKINEGNKVYSDEAKLKLQHYDETTYTMDVGDIYYDNGGITKPSKDEIAAARKNGLTTIGIIGYLGNDYWTEKDVVISEKKVGGHALVMCLKTIESTGKTSIGKGYAWYSSNSTAKRSWVNSISLIADSYKQSYGSGYTETAALINKWGSAAAAAYQAKNYSTLPAPPNKCTGWFLPSAGQYYAILKGFLGNFSFTDNNFSSFIKKNGSIANITNTINEKLSSVDDLNYTEFFGSINTWAWTSSEYSDEYAVGIDSGIDDGHEKGTIRFFFDGAFYQGKKGELPVRPFLAF